MFGFISIFSSVSLVCISILPVLYFFDYISLVVSFEISELSYLFFFSFSILFRFWAPLQFHMNLNISFSISAPQNHQNFGEDCIESVDHFKIAILTMLSILIHEHGMSFHLLRNSLISLCNVLQFPVYKSFTSLVKFIADIFLCYCEWNCFLNFSFELVILVYRNTADCCMLPRQLC